MQASPQLVSKLQLWH